MILRNEFVKIRKLKILWFLAVIFIAFDFLLIMSQEYIREELVSIHQVMDDELLSSLESSEEPVLQYFYWVSQNRLAAYEGLDMMELKATKVHLQGAHLSDKMEQFVSKCYQKLQTRMEEIIATGEADSLFYPGEQYKMHSFLFGTIFKVVLAQISILMVLSVLMAMDYDRIYRTADLVYTSKIGRNRVLYEVISGTGVGTCLSLGLSAVVFGSYFIIYPYKNVWNTFISSGMMMEERGILKYPYITHMPMTVQGYFWITLLVSIFVAVCMGLIAAGIMLLVKNSYLTFLIQVVLCLGWCLLAFQIHTGTLLDTILLFSPAALWMQCGEWFMENSLYTSFKGYEWYALIFNFVIFGALFWLARQRFNRKDM